MKKIYEKIRNADENDREDVVNDFIRENAEKVVELAMSGFSENCCDGVCEMNEDGELESHSYTGNSYNDDTNEEIYRLKANWISQNCWDDHNMLVSNEEWKELKEKYGEEADFTDEKQLESIGVDYRGRLIEYLIYDLEN